MMPSLATLPGILTYKKWSSKFSNAKILYKILTLLRIVWKCNYQATCTSNQNIHVHIHIHIFPAKIYNDIHWFIMIFTGIL